MKEVRVFDVRRSYPTPSRNETRLSLYMRYMLEQKIPADMSDNIALEQMREIRTDRLSEFGVPRVGWASTGMIAGGTTSIDLSHVTLPMITTASHMGASGGHILYRHDALSQPTLVPPPKPRPSHYEDRFSSQTGPERPSGTYR